MEPDRSYRCMCGSTGWDVIAKSPEEAARIFSHFLSEEPEYDRQLGESEITFQGIKVWNPGGVKFEYNVTYTIKVTPT